MIFDNHQFDISRYKQRNVIDDYVREAATIGLLEGIQNIASHTENEVDAKDFLQYLKPETAKWWHQLNDFWEGKIPYVGASINKAKQGKKKCVKNDPY